MSTGHVFKVGHAAPDFAGDFSKGKIADLRARSRALPDEEVTLLFKDGGGEGKHTGLRSLADERWRAALSH